MTIQGSGVPDRYAVIGHPIAHSLSPLVHRCFAEQTNQILSYTRIDALPEVFAETVKLFFREGGRGLNVTLPHKEAAFALAHTVAERAQRAGAVNTLTRGEDGRISGDNTDGIGLVRDLRDNLRIPLHGARILLLGAGGAARGVLEPLLAEEPAALVIANRTPEKSHELARAFRKLGRVKGCTYRVLPDKRFDVIVNATSASVAGQLPPVPDGLAAGAVCYDMHYADHDTPFIRWAREHGARSTHLGFGMLIEQAAESFHIWRGVRPETRAVIALLRHA
jgi:shikimate dehydrogenase